MIIRFGNIWAVLAHKRLAYFKRRPSERTVRAVMNRHAKFA